MALTFIIVTAAGSLGFVREGCGGSLRHPRVDRRASRSGRCCPERFQGDGIRPRHPVRSAGLLTIISEVVAVPKQKGTGRGSRRSLLLRLMSRINKALLPIGPLLQSRPPSRPGPVSVEGIFFPEFGDRLRQVLEDSGGMCVKFGQIASTCSDLLAPTIIDALSELLAPGRPIPPTRSGR